MFDQNIFFVTNINGNNNWYTLSSFYLLVPVSTIIVAEVGETEYGLKNWV